MYVLNKRRLNKPFLNKQAVKTACFIIYFHLYQMRCKTKALGIGSGHLF
jgi:hypothetical protein